MDERNLNQLIEHFQTQMLSGRNYESIIAARKEASSIIEQPIVPGTPEAKQLDEVVERSCVLAARQIVTAKLRERREDARSTRLEIYDALVDLYERQPSLTVRSSTSILQQAYSTPLPVAYLAAQLAQIDETTTVFEPTGGNGALLLLAHPAKVNANEINPERAAFLASQGYAVTTFDATGYLPASPQDVVILNPPFGALPRGDGTSQSWLIEAGVSTKPYRTTQIDRAIALNALKAMKDDGRAVLIIGGKMGGEADRSNRYNSQQNRAFFYTLYQNYNVIRHISIDGDLYRRQGAEFPIDLIVISGRGKSALRLPAADVPSVYRSFSQLKELIPDEPARTVPKQESLDTLSPRFQKPNQPVGSRPSSLSTGGDLDDNRIPAIARSQGRMDDLSSLETDSKTVNLPLDSPLLESGSNGRTALPDGNRRESLEMGATANNRESAPGSEVGVGNGGNIPSIGNGFPRGSPANRDNNAGTVAQSANRNRLRQPGLKEEPTMAEEVLQVPYFPQSIADSVGSLVPSNLRTATTDALTQLEQRVGDLDEYVARELEYGTPENLRQHFSAEQIDALALAIDNLDRGLEQEQGKGFILGDQTGIGKGRVVGHFIFRKLRLKTLLQEERHVLTIKVSLLPSLKIFCTKGLMKLRCLLGRMLAPLNPQ